MLLLSTKFYYLLYILYYNNYHYYYIGIRYLVGKTKRVTSCGVECGVGHRLQLCMGTVINGEV